MAIHESPTFRWYTPDIALRSPDVDEIRFRINLPEPTTLATDAPVAQISIPLPCSARSAGPIEVPEYPFNKTFVLRQ